MSNVAVIDELIFIYFLVTEENTKMAKKPTFQCPICGQILSKCAETTHARRHKNHPETFEIPKYRINHDGLDCQFCGKACKNNNSLRNHERLCKMNPNRQFTPIDNFNNVGRTAWNAGLNKFIDERVAQYSEKIRVANEAGRCGPGTTKRGIYQGFVCDSRWELAFVIYCLDHDIPLSRYSGSGYDYVYENEVHTYYPDFVINDTIIEVKGYCPESVFNKIGAVNDMPVVLLKYNELLPVFSYIRTRYHKDVTKDIEDMYEVRLN